jgi:TonB-linked SusC/RagA family outer membrane protein
MKYSLFFLIVGTLTAVASSSYSQTAKLTLDMQSATVSQVLSRIERESQFYFTYNTREINPDRVVSVQLKDADIGTILKELFAGEDIDYIISDKHVVLYKDSKNEVKKSSQQDIRVSGIVTDNNSEPLPGVNIVVKGTSTGTITDIDGKYVIGVPSRESVLLFSFTGFLTQEITVGNKTQINVSLIEDSKELEEVVVVGFGTQRKVNLTGAVASIEAKAIESRPVRNVTQMLQGLVPGLNISQSSGGSLNSNPSINIRGVATIGQGSTGSPLILIDGVEGDINALNPQDIENVSVLKDASSSSIYGARAPFGVILITTKRGHSGKTVINYNNNLSFNSPILMPKMMNSFDFATYFNDGLINNGATPYFTQERIQRIKDYMDGKLIQSTIPDPVNPLVWSGYRSAYDNVDWYDAIYKEKAFSQEHNLSASGGIT